MKNALSAAAREAAQRLRDQEELRLQDREREARRVLVQTRDEVGKMKSGHLVAMMRERGIGLAHTTHKWTFRSHFRSRVFGWNGSRAACQRLREAVGEIKSLAKTDPVTAAEGVVCLLERIWPAFQHVDSSSGALGGAVGGTQAELLPILEAAPADRKTRDKWLERLWQAIQDDGVDYLWTTEERWGQLCGSSEVASDWANRLLGPLRAAWSRDRDTYFGGTTVCLSSLVAASRHGELLDVLALPRFPFWDYRKFGVEALVKERRLDEALAYAEASRGLNQPNLTINAACEKILLDAGRIDEAYEKYALTGNSTSTGLATFRSIIKKFPDREPRNILLDLARVSEDPGRWFAAAKNAGFLDLALRFARQGRTDPRTLSRASRDFLEKDTRFSLEVGSLAVERILAGDGYELTVGDLLDAYNFAKMAACGLGVEAEFREEALSKAANTTGNGAVFRDSLVRHVVRDKSKQVAQAYPTGPGMI